MRCKEGVSPKKLLLFPSPYPGESFYSILCRYHVRSGNFRDQYTIHQLFGKSRSLRSTLLSPYHIQYANMWFAPGSEISAEALLMEHTAFDLFALAARDYERSHILSMALGTEESTIYPIQVQSRLKHPAGLLRYCPECARVQKKLYGEAYWQILPQLDGVEYCPIHKCKILNSPLKISNITHKFHPASEVLNNRCEPVESPGFIWNDLFAEEERFFIKLAEGMNFLFLNGKDYGGYRRLFTAYDNALGRSGNKYYPSIPLYKVQNAIRLSSYSRKLYDYIVCKSDASPYFKQIFLYSAPLCAHVMLMIILAGDPETFYSL